MSGAKQDPLTFTAVDGLAFAAIKGRRSSKTFAINDVGPLLELVQLRNDGLVQSIEELFPATKSSANDLLAALTAKSRLWICQSTKRTGFYRTSSCDKDLENSYQFGTSAEKAAIEAGFTKKTARQLVAAASEMVDNIYVHSQSAGSGLAAFNARPGCFEFVIADRGIGVLASLRQCSEFMQLSDHGDALYMVLKDGCSRFGAHSNHGHGFRPLFVGLSNLNGSLRFRSGDHALIIDGRNPRSIPWAKIAKPNISGFFASISCRTNANP